MVFSQNVTNAKNIFLVELEERLYCTYFLYFSEMDLPSQYFVLINCTFAQLRPLKTCINFHINKQMFFRSSLPKIEFMSMKTVVGCLTSIISVTIDLLIKETI